jgi:hypothetical protein
LLSGAFLLLRAMGQARPIDPGFRYENVVVLAPNLDSSAMTDEQAQAPVQLLRERLAALPGVASVAYPEPVGLPRPGRYNPHPGSNGLAGGLVSHPPVYVGRPINRLRHE